MEPQFVQNGYGDENTKFSTYMATPALFCLLLHTLILDPPKSLFLMQVANMRNCFGTKNHINFSDVNICVKISFGSGSGSERPIYYGSGRIRPQPEQFLLPLKIFLSKGSSFNMIKYSTFLIPLHFFKNSTDPDPGSKLIADTGSGSTTMIKLKTYMKNSP
jgi:hypothetical protein